MVSLRGGKYVEKAKAAATPGGKAPSLLAAAPSPSQPKHAAKTPPNSDRAVKSGRTPSSDANGSADVAAQQIAELQEEVKKFRKLALLLKKDCDAHEANAKDKDEKLIDVHKHVQLLEARHAQELKIVKAKVEAVEAKLQAEVEARKNAQIELKEVRLKLKEVRLQRDALKANEPRAPPPPPPAKVDDDSEAEVDDDSEAGEEEEQAEQEQEAEEEEQEGGAEEGEVAHPADNDDDDDDGLAEIERMADELAEREPSSESESGDEPPAKRPGSVAPRRAAAASQRDDERPAKRPKSVAPRRASAVAAEDKIDKQLRDLANDEDNDDGGDGDDGKKDAELNEEDEVGGESSEDLLKARKPRSAFVKALPQLVASRSPNKGPRSQRVPFALREKQNVVKGVIKHKLFSGQGKADWNAILHDKSLDFHPKRDGQAIKDCYRNLLNKYYNHDLALLMKDTDASRLLGAAGKDDESE